MLRAVARPLARSGKVLYKSQHRLGLQYRQISTVSTLWQLSRRSLSVFSLHQPATPSTGSQASLHAPDRAFSIDASKKPTNKRKEKQRQQANHSPKNNDTKTGTSRPSNMSLADILKALREMRQVAIRGRHPGRPIVDKAVLDPHIAQAISDLVLHPKGSKYISNWEPLFDVMFDCGAWWQLPEEVRSSLYERIAAQPTKVFNFSHRRATRVNMAADVRRPGVIAIALADGLPSEPGLLKVRDWASERAAECLRLPNDHALEALPTPARIEGQHGTWADPSSAIPDTSSETPSLAVTKREANDGVVEWNSVFFLASTLARTYYYSPVLIEALLFRIEEKILWSAQQGHVSVKPSREIVHNNDITPPTLMAVIRVLHTFDVRYQGLLHALLPLIDIQSPCFSAYEIGFVTNTLGVRLRGEARGKRETRALVEKLAGLYLRYFRNENEDLSEFGMSVDRYLHVPDVRPLQIVAKDNQRIASNFWYMCLGLRSFGHYLYDFSSEFMNRTLLDLGDIVAQLGDRPHLYTGFIEVFGDNSVPLTHPVYGRQKMFDWAETKLLSPAGAELKPYQVTAMLKRFGAYRGIHADPIHVNGHPDLAHYFISHLHDEVLVTLGGSEIFHLASCLWALDAVAQYPAVEDEVQLHMLHMVEHVIQRGDLEDVRLEDLSRLLSCFAVFSSLPRGAADVALIWRLLEAAEVRIPEAQYHAIHFLGAACALAGSRFPEDAHIPHPESGEVMSPVFLIPPRTRTAVEGRLDQLLAQNLMPGQVVEDLAQVFRDNGERIDQALHGDAAGWEEERDNRYALMTDYAEHWEQHQGPTSRWVQYDTYE